MATELILWLSMSSLAVLFLLTMMRRRQTVLVGMLADYVQRQAQWARRRAKAEAIIAEQAKTAADAISALASAAVAAEESLLAQDTTTQGAFKAAAAQN